jgi:hypothetical protein
METLTCLDLAATTQMPIKLEQQGVNNFKVIYGKQAKRCMSYEDAAAELGECIMHWLACQGLLDNSDPP